MRCSRAAAPVSSTTSASKAAAGAGGSSYGGGGASAATTASSGAPASGTPITAKHGKLGTILAAGPKQLTVYLFEGDKGAASACSGACASAWPPVTTAAVPSAGAGAIAADLGTITRADGSKQVIYKGHPLYFFIKDKDRGDAYGQGSKAFGADWYVLSPSGIKVDHS